MGGGRHHLAGAGAASGPHPAGTAALRSASPLLARALRANCASGPASTTATCRCGGLQFCRADEADAADRAWDDEGDIAFEASDERRTAHFEPALAPSRQGVITCRTMAQVRNPRHVKALRGVVRTHGVGLRPGCPASASSTGPGSSPRRDAPTGRSSAGKFLVAAGAWTDALLDPVGCRLGVRPVPRPDRPAQHRRAAVPPHHRGRQALPGAAARRPGAGRLDRGGRRLRQADHGGGGRRGCSRFACRPGAGAGGRPRGALLGRAAAGQPGRAAVPRAGAGDGQPVRRGGALPGRHPALAGHRAGDDGTALGPAAERAAGGVPPRPTASPADSSRS